MSEPNIRLVIAATAIVVGFIFGYLAFGAESVPGEPNFHSSATIGGEKVPSLSCFEDEVIWFSESGFECMPVDLLGSKR